MNRTMISSFNDAVFYHIYPLGLCGAPFNNDGISSPVERLSIIDHWLDHIANLGINAVYIGPVFESGTHGYDTIDYYRIDRRLGTNATLRKLVERFHAKGIRVVLDAVLNHTGRDFPQFKELLKDPHTSVFRDWFSGINYHHRSPCGDPFTYDSWNGCYDLVKLNLHNPKVKEHLLRAVESWVREFDIDGLRLDAADCLDPGFLRDLSALCKRIKPGFWLMGEMVHGNYRKLLDDACLDSVTNYECYKGLYSSHNDRNFFEIAYALNRQFGNGGLYKDAGLYNFCDNHDVNRIASMLNNPAHLFTVYALLFTMPGIPSIYYGSEWFIHGRKKGGDDHPLRPALELGLLERTADPSLVNAIRCFSRLRSSLRPLRHGTYRQVALGHEYIVFARDAGDESVLVAVNTANTAAALKFNFSYHGGTRLVDLLNNNASFQIMNGTVEMDIPPRWARIMKVM